MGSAGHPIVGVFALGVAHLQQILPDATLVGGTASALFAQHRVSYDADHMLTA